MDGTHIVAARYVAIYNSDSAWRAPGWFDALWPLKLWLNSKGYNAAGGKVWKIPAGTSS